MHEILGFEILSSEKHFCHGEISEILFGVRGLDPWSVSLHRGNGLNNTKTIFFSLRLAGLGLTAKVGSMNLGPSLT